LVQIKIKQTLITPKNRQVQKHKWDRQSLNLKEKTNKYQEHLQLMLQEIKEETDINHDWQNIKQEILDAATEFQLARDAMKPNHWGTMNVRQQSTKIMKQEEYVSSGKQEQPRITIGKKGQRPTEPV
jgi:hypothetical protein